MKKLKHYKSILIAVFLTTALGCDNNGHKDLSQSPTVTPKVSVNDEGESTIDLVPINSTMWNDPELEEAESAIRTAREERVRARLEPIKEETLEISHPTATFKHDGRVEVMFDVTFQDETESITFISPEDFEENFLFIKSSGFSKKIVTLQGMCLNPEANCSTIAIQVAYLVDSLEITQQFILKNPNAEDELNETEEEAETSQPEEEEEETQSENTLSDVQPEVQTEIETLKAQDPQSEVFDLNIIDTKEDRPLNTNAPSAPALPNAPDLRPSVDLNSSPDLERAEGDAPFVMSEAPQLGSFNAVDNTPSFPEEESLPPQTQTAPVKFDLNEIDTESAIEVDKTITEAPEEEEPAEDKATNLAPESSLRPQNRPSTDESEFAIGHTNAAFLTGAGRFTFPNLKESTNSISESFNIDSAEAYQVTASSNSSDEMIQRIQTHHYNQSRNYYTWDEDSRTHGRIRNSTQLESRINGAVVNPGRRSKQFGSGILIDTLKYASEKLAADYPNAPVCINDLSLRNGGNIGGHASHENGLDADVSYPGIRNSCSGSYFLNWDELDNGDDSFRQKNWEFINHLLSTDRVHVIFADRSFIRALCRHVKRNVDISRAERNKVFKKLHHVNGHRHHYHIRMKCTDSQNPGCKTQGILTGETCN